MSSRRDTYTDTLVDIEKGFGIEFKRTNHNVFCPHCEDSESSKSPSCSVHIHGFYKCQSCHKRGHVVNFYAHKNGLTPSQARDELLIRDKDRRTRLVTHLQTIEQEYRELTRKSSLTYELVEECAENLLKLSNWQKFLRTARGLNTDTIATFDLGVDEHRLTIPVLDENGEVLGIRRYHPKSKPKMVNNILGDTRPHLWPLQQAAEVSDGDPILLCEGEFDCMMLWQYGFKAFTNTGNAGVWNHEWTSWLASNFPNSHLYIVYDVHDKKMDYGQRMAKMVAMELVPLDLKVHIIELPLPSTYVGGDITDWFVKEGRTAEEIRALMNKSPLIEMGQFSYDEIYPPGSDDTEEEDEDVKAQKQEAETSSPTERVSLSDASHSRHYKQRITIRALVAGKRVAPYIVPRKVSAIVSKKDGDSDVLDRVFKPNDPIILQLLDCTASTQKQLLKSIFGLTKDESARFVIHDTMNVEEIYLIPAVDRHQDDGSYVMRTAFYVGHGLEANQVYEFVGITVADPKSQAATHLLYGCKPAGTNLDDFSMNADEIKELRETFACTDEDVLGKLEDIAQELSQYVTNIVGRNDLHIAIDLVFHSPLSFILDKHFVHRGWLDVLIFGDTRTGKGFVTEGMIKHYKAGEMVSGENVSFAGLVGGLQRLGDRWSLVWGKIPINDRRLVVIDECSGLSTTEFSKLSRVRSEGVAEITKIISEKTRSRCRLLWIGNPRPTQDGTPKTLSSYNYGVEGVSELIGAAEDIARFDYVLTVGQNEVSAQEINISRHAPSTEQKYTSERCNRLLTWAWARKPEDIMFTEGAVNKILKASMALGKHFSPTICLIQSEDVRYKLARIAVAAAMRTFSTDSLAEKVYVEDKHVTFAFNFLYHIYSKASCGYLDLSTVIRERSVLRDPRKVLEVINTAAKMCKIPVMDVVDALLEHRKITRADFVDFTGIDEFQARNTISDLVRARAIIKEHSYYVKKPAFKSFLLKLKAKLAGEEVTAGRIQGEKQHV